MDELNGNRSFTDSGSDALHRAMAHIAHRENARHVGFEQERISIEFHPLGRWPSRIRSGPVRINPRSSRSTSPPSQSVLGSAPIKMNMAVAGTRSTLLVSEHRKEISSRCVSPWTSDTLACGPDLNVGRLLDLVDQILRHGARERGAAHHDDTRARRILRNSWPPGPRSLLRRSRRQFHPCRIALRSRLRRNKRPLPASDRFPEPPVAATALRWRSSRHGKKFRYRPPI